MKKNNANSLRMFLDQTPTARLDEMLWEELSKESADEELVGTILQVLEERERDYPVEITPQIEAAWEKYQRQMKVPVTKPAKRSNGILRIAAVLAVVVLLFAAVPQKAEAETFFERLVRWTDSFFALLSPDDAKSGSEEYVFKTDHPGLQQVYDALAELGVTEPVVPMWIPEEYKLVDCKVLELPSGKCVSVEFSDGLKNLCFYVDIYAENISNKYYKDETQVNKLEIGGTVHNIMRNNDIWSVIWARDNLECSLAIDCQEDVLIRILRSIYTMEDE